MYYPKWEKDLMVPLNVAGATEKRSCVCCGYTAYWAPSIRALDKALCFACADSWRKYSNEYKLSKWHGLTGWLLEFDRQFNRFLAYARSQMRNLATMQLKEDESDVF